MLSSLLTAFARSRPHWKPWRRISLSYSWVAHPLHFPENQCTHFPVYFLQFQPDTLVWVVWHRKKMPGHVDKLSDDTTSSDLQQDWWMTAELRGDAGGWHWLQEGCWWLSWGRSEHAVCIGSLPLSIIEKKKEMKRKKYPFAIQITPKWSLSLKF